jgi:hypothetical protein
VLLVAAAPFTPFGFEPLFADVAIAKCVFICLLEKYFFKSFIEYLVLSI